MAWTTTSEVRSLDTGGYVATFRIAWNMRVGQDGSFKTCHDAEMVTPPTDAKPHLFDGTFTAVAKRPYKELANGKKDRLSRLAEADVLDGEAACHRWGILALKKTYAFIKNMNDAGNGVDVDVPVLRYVHMAMVEAKAGMYFLLEEKIEGRFTKYVSNGGGEPVSGLSAGDLHIAEFLCFVQHHLYLEMGGQMIITDFQGECLSRGRRGRAD